MIYFTADHHFGHKNIIKYCNRPFETVEEMEEELIRRWNEVVEETDLVYFLGDFAYTMPLKRIREIVSRLHGKKVLVMGNHDKQFSKATWESLGFLFVSEGPILFEDKYWLSHEPEKHHRYKNIHAHTHNHKPNSPLERDRYCVSVELTEYYPVSLTRASQYFLNCELLKEELSCQ